MNNKWQSLVFGILTSLDIDPSLWLSPLLSLFLILKAELNSEPQNSAWFIGVGQTLKTCDLS